MLEGHIFLPRRGDRETVLERREYYRSLSDEELIESYNEACAQGFFGSHGQALDTIAKRSVFIERFKESPITITGNSLIEFTGPIRAEGKGWVHVTPPDREKSA